MLLLDLFTHKLTRKADSWLRSLWYIFMGAVSTIYMNINSGGYNRTLHAGNLRQENAQIKPSD